MELVADDWNAIGKGVKATRKAPRVNGFFE